jgi:hypothetical protein
MVDRNTTAPPPGAPRSPRTAIECWREISQLHVCIAAAMRELDELMAEWLRAQNIDDEPQGGAS